MRVRGGRLRWAGLACFSASSLLLWCIQRRPARCCPPHRQVLACGAWGAQRRVQERGLTECSPGQGGASAAPSQRDAVSSWCSCSPPNSAAAAPHSFAVRSAKQAIASLPTSVPHRAASTARPPAILRRLLLPSPPCPPITTLSGHDSHCAPQLTPLMFNAILALPRTAAFSLPLHGMPDVLRWHPPPPLLCMTLQCRPVAITKKKCTDKRAACIEKSRAEGDDTRSGD